MLGKLTKEWAPHAFHVSFKLETDMDLVVSKARAAIEKYGVHLVVANQLQTRKNVVYLVYRSLLPSSSSGGNSSSSSSSSSGNTGNRGSLGVSTSGKELISYVSSVGASDSGKADFGSLLSDTDNYVVDEIRRPENEELIEPVLVEAVRSAHRAFVRGARATRNAPSSSSTTTSSSSAVAATAGGGAAGATAIVDDCFSACVDSPTLPARFIKAHVDRFNQGGGGNNKGNQSNGTSQQPGSDSSSSSGGNYGKKNKTMDENDDTGLGEPNPSAMEITIALPRLFVGLGFISVIAFMIGRISNSSRTSN